MTPEQHTLELLRAAARKLRLVYDRKSSRGEVFSAVIELCDQALTDLPAQEQGAFKVGSPDTNSTGGFVNGGLAANLSDWIEHDGKGMPVDPETAVEVLTRCGQTYSGDALQFWWTWADHTPMPGDIVHYRIVKPAARDTLASAKDAYETLQVRPGDVKSAADFNREQPECFTPGPEPDPAPAVEPQSARREWWLNIYPQYSMAIARVHESRLAALAGVYPQITEPVHVREVRPGDPTDAQITEWREKAAMYDGLCK